MSTATSKRQRKYRFRLLQGHHVGEKGFPGDVDYNRTHTYNSRDPQNNIVESDKNLMEHMGYEKFELLTVDGEMSGAYGDYMRKRSQQSSDLEELEKMTVAELKELAAEQEIDLMGAQLKADIINTIRQYQSS